MNWARPIILTIGGQAVWAVGQACIVFVLSSQSLYGLVGLFILGLAIFTPLGLIGNLNLRTSVAIDQAGTVSATDVLILRTIVVVIAFTVTCLALIPAARSYGDWFAAVSLLAVRIGDQVSDAAIGFFQRNGRQDLIARSFLLRGLASVVPFVTALVLTDSVLAGALCSLLATFSLVYLHDVRPLISTIPSIFGLLDKILPLLERTRVVGPYPALDSLHFNSFRYAIFLGTSAEYVGLVGVAQTLFVPFQLVATALGFNYLPVAAQLANKGGTIQFRRHVVFGIGLGFFVTASFLLFAFTIPEWGLALVFGAPPEAAKSVVMLVAVAMLPLPASGFTALCLIARGRERLYTFGPIVGIGVFWLSILAVLAIGAQMATPEVVSVAFLFSMVVRLVVASVGAMLSFEREKQETQRGTIS